MDAFTLEPTQVRDLSDRLLDAQRRLGVVLPRAFETTTRVERLLFGMRHGLYGFATLKLVDFLHERIAGHSVVTATLR